MKRLLSCFLLSCAACAFLAGSALAWEKLGEKKVDFSQSSDRIEVGKKEGKFTKIQIRVKDAPVEIYSMVLRFGNDDKFEPNLKEKFQPGTESRAITLPGNRKRTIKTIKFDYKSVKVKDKKNQNKSNDKNGGNKKQKATVQVWAE